LVLIVAVDVVVAGGAGGGDERPDEVYGRGGRVPQPNPKRRPETTTRMSLARSCTEEATSDSDAVAAAGRASVRRPQAAPPPGSNGSSSARGWAWRQVAAEPSTRRSGQVSRHADQVLG
jgi:hypothetical protein